MRPPDQEGDNVTIESDIERATRITNDYLIERPVWLAVQAIVVPIIEGIAGEFDRPINVDPRLKPPKSLMLKLLTRSTEVTQLHEITDLFGIRIVTQYLDSIASIVARIEEVFRVNEHKSGLRINPAGYRTRHVVCALPSNTPPRWFEIQIRTVGEHVWSEIQHAIYKGAAADEDTTETLVRISTLFHEAESLAAGVRQRLQAGRSL